MTDWVARELGVDRAEADRLRDHYWRRYGTTLAGLMAEHDVDPGPYMTEVHDIDFSVLSPDPVLAARIAALPGRRIVYTNGSEPYARRVIAARGLTGVFDAVYGVEHANFLPKPELGAFEAVFALDGCHPNKARCSRMIPAIWPFRMRWGCGRSLSGRNGIRATISTTMQRTCRTSCRRWSDRACSGTAGD